MDLDAHFRCSSSRYDGRSDQRAELIYIAGQGQRRSACGVGLHPAAHAKLVINFEVRATCCQGRCHYLAQIPNTDVVELIEHGVIITSCDSSSQSESSLVSNGADDVRLHRKLIVVVTASERFIAFIVAGMVTDCIRMQARAGYHLADGKPY